MGDHPAPRWGIYAEAVAHRTSRFDDGRRARAQWGRDTRRLPAEKFRRIPDGALSRPGTKGTILERGRSEIIAVRVIFVASICLTVALGAGCTEGNDHAP